MTHAWVPPATGDRMARDAETSPIAVLVQVVYGGLLGISLGTVSQSLTVGALMSPVIIAFSVLRSRTPHHAEPPVWIAAKVWLRRAGALAGLAAAVTAVSAVVQRTPVPWVTIFSPLIVLCVAVSCGILCRWRPRGALRIMICALAASVFYSVLVDPGDPRAIESFTALWKYAIGVPVTIFVLSLLAVFAAPRVAHMVCLTGLSVVSLLLDYRQLGLLCALAAVVLGVGLSGGRVPLRRLVAALLASGIVAWGVFQGMTAGLFGSELADRTVVQLSSGSAGTNLLAASRTETPLSLTAIWERPVFGWGNVANIDGVTIGRALDFADTAGYGSMEYLLNYWIRPDGTISLHSIFFTSWVEGGLLMAATACVLGWFCMKSIRGTRNSKEIYPVSLLLGMIGIVDLIFSPWSGFKAVLYGFTVLLACVATNTRIDYSHDVKVETRNNNVAHSG
jgi:hypothetical protein